MAIGGAVPFLCGRQNQGVKLQQGASAAVSTLLKIMVDQHSPPSTRVRAADSVLDHGAKAIEIEDIEARVSELERAAGTPNQHDGRYSPAVGIIGRPRRSARMTHLCSVRLTHMKNTFAAGQEMGPAISSRPKACVDLPSSAPQARRVLISQQETARSGETIYGKGSDPQMSSLGKEVILPR